MTTPDGPFRELVKAEFHATWRGRWRWLWWMSAMSCLALAAFIPEAALMGSMSWLAPLWLPVYWAPVILGSDLLCTRLPQNPDPLREWPGRAFAARAIGRLAPVLLVIGGSYLFAVSRPDSSGVDIPWGINAALLVAHLLNGALTFAISALIGSGTRRPRRMVVTLGLQTSLMAMNLMFANQSLITRINTAGVWEQIFHLTTSGFSVTQSLSALMVAALVDAGVATPHHPLERLVLGDLCLFWLLAAVMMGLWAVISLRINRRPNSNTLFREDHATRGAASP